MTVEIDKTKGSRFIADVAPAGDEVQAEAAIGRVRSREPDATHHCFAWRIGPDRTRAADDGEPSGTAGPPILRRIDASGLDRVVVVVTRYYGGTKLGTGGLVRAYGAAAEAGLAAVPVERGVVTRSLRIEHDYELSAPVAGALAAHEAVTLESEYAMKVVLRVAVPEERAEAFAAALREATAGRARVRPA